VVGNRRQQDVDRPVEVVAVPDAEHVGDAQPFFSTARSSVGSRS